MATQKEISELKEILLEKKATIEKNIEGSKENTPLLQDSECNDESDYAGS